MYWDRRQAPRSNHAEAGNVVIEREVVQKRPYCAGDAAGMRPEGRPGSLDGDDAEPTGKACWQSYWELMSALSPLPPGWPSLPMERMSYSPLLPGERYW